MPRPTTPRRYLNGTLDADLSVTRQIDKSRVHEVLILCVDSGVQYLHQLALVAVAHVEAMQLATGRTTLAIRGRDVADVLGIAETRATSLLGELKRAGLVEGSATGGYRLPPPK